MRSILELFSLAALALLAWVTSDVLTRPERFTGTLIGAGASNLVLVLPFAAVSLYLFITCCHPSAADFPVRLTRENRARMENLTLCMMGCVKAEILCLFLWVQTVKIAAAEGGHVSFTPGLMPLSLGIIGATIAAHVFAMRRTA